MSGIRTNAAAELLGVEAAPPWRHGGIRQDVRQDGCVSGVDGAKRNHLAA